MSLVITQRPSTTIGDQTSKWNVVRNPLVYKAQRKDFVFDLVNDAATFLQLEFTGVDVSANFSVDDVIYIKSDNGVYDLFSTVTASAFSGGDTLITVDDLYISAAPGGFTNNGTLRPLYRVEVEVYDSTDTIIGDVHIFSPTTKGYLLIDISEVVKSSITPDNEADLTSSTDFFQDSNAFVKFYIKYTEVWTGSAESQTDDVSNQFFAVGGARQIPSTYGGNLAEYVAFKEAPGTNYGQVTHSRNSVGTSNGSGQAVTPDETNEVKVVVNASVTNQVGSAGVVGSVSLKFELNSVVVFTYQILNFNIGAGPTSQSSGTVTEYFDSSDFGVGGFDNYYIEVIVASGSGTYLAQGTANVYHSLQLAKFLTRFETPSMWRGYPFIISLIKDDFDAVNTQVLVSYFDADGNVITSTATTIFTTEDKLFLFNITALIAVPDNAVRCDIVFYITSTGRAVSENLSINVLDPCDNPIMLVGRNSLGGAMQWVFEVSQEEDFNYSNDYKRKRQILSGAGLTKNEWDSLQDFITVGEVYRENIVELTSSVNKTSKRIDQQLYIVDTDGNKIGVISNTTRNRTQTKLNQHYFEIEIEYPEEF